MAVQVEAVREGRLTLLPSLFLLQLERTGKMGQVLNKKENLVACFEQPVTKVDFKDRVNNQNVCLEQLSIKERSVTGTVVLKKDGLKEGKVLVRYTLDDWSTFSEIQAKLNGKAKASTSNNDVEVQNRFTFVINVPDNKSLEFAICCRVGEQEHWDNNSDRNYRVTEVVKSS